MALNIPPIVLPPRPPELPAVPPPKGQGDPFLRNDAFLAVWIDEIERVIKDAWLRITNLFIGIDARITILEARIADTYTWGQKGALTIEEPEEGEEETVTTLALPLRIVRAEVIVECTAAAEKPGLGGVLIVQHWASGPIVVEPPPIEPPLPRADERPWTDVATLTLDAGTPFVTVALPTPRKVAKDDTLRVVIAEVGEGGEDDEEAEVLSDVVVQARCR